MDYVAPGFKRLHLVETENVTENVAATLVNEPPFNELVIPASGPILQAVGLGRIEVEWTPVSTVRVQYGMIALPPERRQTSSG